MISRHAHNTAVSVRVDPDVRTAANAELEARGWKLAEFVATCLNAVGSDPDRIIRAVARHRVERPRKGRPPRDTDG